MNDLSLLTSFDERLNRLPSKIKMVLDAPETGDMIYEICIDYNVHNRVSSYSALIGMILMGSLNPNLLVKSIVEKEGLDVDTAKDIALDISAAIFQPIKQELIAMYGLTPKPPAPSMAPEPTQNKPEPIEQAAPSTRKAGISLPEIPIPTALPVPEPMPSTLNPTPSEKIFYSPSPNPPKPNIIDLSKEPPRPVAQPGDPPLEGNIVNLKTLPPSV